MRVAQYLVLVIASSVLASVALAAPPESPVDRAQLRVAAIEARLASLPTEDRMLEGFSAEGTRVTAFGRGKAIEKLEVEALDESGRRLLDFHWLDGQLLAARERRIDYGANIAELKEDAEIPQAVVADDRFEFDGARLVGWRRLRGDMPIADDAARARAKDLRALACSFRRLMTTSPPKGRSGEGACAWSCARERGNECRLYRCE